MNETSDLQEVPKVDNPDKAKNKPGRIRIYPTKTPGTVRIGPVVQDKP